MSHFTLNPALPILLRPDGDVQVGWDPRRAVLVHPPDGLDGDALATLLRALRSPTTAADLQHQASALGLCDADALTALLAALTDAGVLREPPRRRGHRSASIRVHGRGPLSDLLVQALRCSGSRIKHSHQPNATSTAADTDLVVLADALVTEPQLVRDLHAEGVAHLPVRVRDGTGLVGPLVIPGMTSCLTCADLHRSDRDSAWPAVAAQLRDAVGTADRATVLATAALALNEVQRVIAAITGGPTPQPPPTLNATLEFDLAAGSIVARSWTKHPLCGC